MASHTVKQAAPGVASTRIALALGVLAAICVKLGLGQVASFLTDYEDPIAAIVLVIAPYVAAVLAKKKTTPVDSPRDNDGNKLVPEGTPPQIDAAAAAALAEAEATFPSADATTTA